MKINLLDYFEDTVRLFPEKLAISDSASLLTFKELRQRAKILALHISEREHSFNESIAVFLPKTNDAIVSFIAILYSGNIYAPIDTKSPIQRNKSILQSLNPIKIITNSDFINKIKELDLNIDIINIDELVYTNIDDFEFNYKKCIDTDPAYIIHTSGSTGNPKGVAICHRSIIDYISWAIETFQVSEKESIGNQAPFIFDNSTLDIYLMMFTGATLHLIPEELFIFPAKLLSFLNTNKITFVFWVPSVLINIANLKLLETIQIQSINKVLFAGEVMPIKYLNHWIHNLKKDVLFANLYGPTEITVDCTYYIVDRKFKDNEVLPIGKPCKNSDVIILNKKNQVCQIGESGELCVRGTSLALGYWNDFIKTKTVFVQNPLNNSFPEKIYRTGDIVYLNDNSEIIFIGRNDNQIKHLGYRIELGEIEHSVLSVFNDINAVIEYNYLKNEICLFYQSKHNIGIVEFRKKLSRVLPKYMIPTRYIQMDILPLTSSGKKDRVTIKNLIKDENHILWRRCL